MEVLYHDLASGKDSSLSQVLAAWNSRYEEQFKALHAAFAQYGEVNSEHSQTPELSFSELREQFEEVLQLRATLMVEVDALQQIRAELEDSQCLSEVHIQLERATEENKRLQSAIRSAHEQISDLFFNKRVMEAEMVALRGDRDRQLAEANERVRMAEKAVVAMTSRIRGPKPNGTEEKPSVPSQPAKTFVPFQPVVQRLSNAERTKSFATITGMSFDEFDSLDEDEQESEDTDVVDEAPPVPSHAPVQHTEMNGQFSGPKDSSPNEYPDAIVSDKLSSTAPELDTDTFVLDEQHETDVPPSPASSSTPRKSLEVPDSNNSNRYIGTPLLTEASTDWATTIMKCREEVAETVPKAEYLKLLDDFEEVRLELDSVRRDLAAKVEAGAAAYDQRRLEDEYSNSRPNDPGLTEQLHDLAEKVCTATPDQVQHGRGSLLPPTAPGTTRMFDWSVSPDQTASSLEMQVDSAGPEEDMKEQEKEEDERTPVRTNVPVVCNSCLALQAELVTTEVLASTQFNEYTRISNAQIATLELELHSLREKLDQEDAHPPTLDSSIQTEPSEIEEKQDEGLVVNVETLPAWPASVEPLKSTVLLSTESQTEHPGSPSESNTDSSVMVKRYSKLSADAACICLALAQRLASMNHRGVPDGEHSPDTNDEFNNLLTALSNEEQEESDVDTDSHRSGYKLLACSLARLNHEVERLASVVDTREYNPFEYNHEKLPQTNGDYSQDREHEVVELRTRLSAALQLLSERLPADTQKALIATTQIVESERIQLQAELERRMVMFEQSHTSSVAELESSRRDLIEQLATAESENVQLKDQLCVAQQKLQANDRFIAEQTEERETEREEFRTELARLETQLRKAKGELLALKLVNGASVAAENTIASPTHNKSLWLDDSIDVSETDTLSRVQDCSHISQTPRRHTMITCLQEGNSLLGTSSYVDRRFSDVPHARDWSTSPQILKMTNNSGAFDLHSPSSDSLSRTPLAVMDKSCHCSSLSDRSPIWPQRNELASTSVAFQESFKHCAVSLIPSSSSYCQTEPDDDIVAQSASKTGIPLVYSNDASNQTDFELVPLEELVQLQKRIRQLEETNILAPSSIIAQRRPSWLTDDDTDSTSGLACDSRVCVDSSTQTLDHEENDSSPELVTKTKRTVRTRTWDAAAAATFLGQLTLTEEQQEVESSVVKRERRGSRDSNRNQQESIRPDLKHQAVNTEPWNSSSPSQLEPKRSRSLPSLVSSMGDTGVEMSRGLTMLDSIDLTVLDMSHVAETKRSRDVTSIGTQRPPLQVDSIQSYLSSAIENMDTTLIQQVAEDQSISLASVTSLDPTVEVLVDLHSPPPPAPPPQNISVSCDTEELELKLVPASDLQALLEQKDALDVVVSTMREEIASLQKHHSELQTDYNFLQEMLEERECELERFTQESIALQTRCSAMEREIKERRNVVLERDEDMFVLTEANEALTARVRELEELVASSQQNSRLLLEVGVQVEEDMLVAPKKYLERGVDVKVCTTLNVEVQTDPDSVVKNLTNEVHELEYMLEASQSRVVESNESAVQTAAAFIVEDLLAKAQELEANRSAAILSTAAAVEIVTPWKDSVHGTERIRDWNLRSSPCTADTGMQTDAAEFAVCLSARMQELEQQLKDRPPRRCMMDGQIQTDAALFTRLPFVPTAAVPPAKPTLVDAENEQCDTIVDGTSTLHSFNDFEEAELAEPQLTEQLGFRSVPILVTSTPDRQSELSDALPPPPTEEPDANIPTELKTLVERLRTESLRLFSLSTVVQPTDLSQRPIGNEGHPPTPTVQHQFSVVSNLVQANTSLKNALKQLSQIIENQESLLPRPSPDQLMEPLVLSNEQVHKFIQCIANALEADESVWLGLLHLSLDQTIGHAAMVSKSLETETNESLQKLVWKSISRLGDQLSAFVRQEDKYRECVIQAHLVEQQYLNAELQTAVSRADSLAAEINRLTERLSSHKEALGRADSLNLRLANQVNNLKADLANVNSDLQTELMQSEQKQAQSDRLNTQLLEEQRMNGALRAQIENLKSDIDRLEQELRETKGSLADAQCAVTAAVKRTEGAEQAAEQARLYYKPVHNASFSPEHSSVLDVTPGESAISSQDNTSPLAHKDLFNAISRTATNLAMARHTASKAERRARELEATNKALRLNLAETELRLMPLLVAFTQSPTSSCPVTRDNNIVTVYPPPLSVRELHSQLQPSSRFAELKDVCNRLLSLASNEEQEDGVDRNPSSGQSSDDEVIPDNPPVVSRAVSFNPTVSVCQVANEADSHVSPQTPVTRIRVDAERDEEQLMALPKDPILRLRQRMDSIPIDRVECSVSLNVSTVSTLSFTNQTPSRFSSSSAPEQTVSLERFRNIHARYLRAESYRRALTFQKRYLLLLLGGFQYPEEAVVASLGRPDASVYSDQASLAATDSGDGFPPSSGISLPLRRFRAAARTAQVIYRMRHMMNRWRRSGLHTSTVIQPPSGAAQPASAASYVSTSITNSQTPDCVTRFEPTYVSTISHLEGPIYPNSMSRFSSHPVNAYSTSSRRTMPTLTTGSTQTVPSLLPTSQHSGGTFRSSTTPVRPSMSQSSSGPLTTGLARSGYSVTTPHRQPSYPKTSPSTTNGSRPRASTDYRSTSRHASARSSTNSTVSPDERFRIHRFSFR